MKCRYLTVEQVLRIHAYAIQKHGGSTAIVNIGHVESAVALPEQGFGGQELYPTLAEKASALGYSLNKNHGFADGNKRTAAMAVVMFLSRNGYTLTLDVDEEEQIYLGVATGTVSRDEYAAWIKRRMRAKGRRPKSDRPKQGGRSK